MMYCCLNSESHSLPLYTPFSCLQVSQSLSQICSTVTHSLFPSAPQSPTHFPLLLPHHPLTFFPLLSSHLLNFFSLLFNHPLMTFHLASHLLLHCYPHIVF
jgi:hypothetical protein